MLVLIEIIETSWSFFECWSETIYLKFNENSRIITYRVVDYNIKYFLNIIFLLCCKIIMGEILEVERISGITMRRRMLQMIKLALLAS